MNQHFSSSIAFVYILSVLLTLTGCAPGIFSEIDEVKKLNRHKLNLLHLYNTERNSPLCTVSQTFVKECQYGTPGASHLIVYDQLRLRPQAHNIEDTVYFILSNEILPIPILDESYRESQAITESTSDILTADSTTVRVVNGYSLNDYKYVNLSYELSKEVKTKIYAEKEFKIRYYSGPDMITIRLKGRDLNNLKKLISMS